MRCPQTNLHSIERLYATVRNNLTENIQVRVTHARLNNSTWIIPLILDAWRVSRLKSDVYHVTGGTHFLTYFLSKSRTILTIHDLRNLDRLTGIRRIIYKLLWYSVPLKRSDTIVVISEATKMALIDQFNIDDSRIHVIPNTAPYNVSENELTITSSSKYTPTVLLLGTRPPKNLTRQLKAVARLSDINPEIRIIGQLTTEQKMLIKKLNLTVENSFNLSDSELMHCYRSATVLLFASIEEGFGMPIIEAQSTGLPVITSNTSSMPEVAGDGAIIVNPYSIDEIENALRLLLTDQEIRDEVATRGLNNCTRFSPVKVASMYASLYYNVGLHANQSHASTNET